MGCVTKEAKARTHDALMEMQTVLRIVASAGSLDRIWAFRYTHCRDLLLGSELRPNLPGFLHQCISIDNFHQFIRANVFQSPLQVHFFGGLQLHQFVAGGGTVVS